MADVPRYPRSTSHDKRVQYGAVDIHEARLQVVGVQINDH